VRRDRRAAVRVIVRLVLFGLIATIGISLVAWVFTRQRRYLTFALNVLLRASVIVLLALGLMFLLERSAYRGLTPCAVTASGPGRRRRSSAGSRAGGAVSGVSARFAFLSVGAAPGERAKRRR
jgi:hypothetical protein